MAKEINASRWVTGSNVNVRTKPSTQGSSVAKLNKNAQVYVTKKYTNGWCKIKTDSGVEGYMTSEYLTDEDPSNVKSSSKKNSSQSTKNSTKSSSNSSGVRLMYPKNNNIPLYYLQGDKLYGYKERVTIYQAFNVFFETNIKGESYYYTETNINGKTLSCYVRTVSLH